MHSASELPLAGLKVAEFSHMVMGPSIGVILGDLGADVVKVEPIEGDATRRLRGSGAGYFSMFNRNKRSVSLNLKDARGLAVARRLAAASDIVIENFRPGAMDALGLGYQALAEHHPRLIYCSAKGFLSGPYEQRTALDEVAQMMGGLAYMTGPPGRPLRAGASVIDIAGGMFGVIGILAALEQRRRTGLGQHVQCSLFETTAFLVGQHMAQRAVTGEAPPPMPARLSAWAIYDVFETARKDEQVFLGVVSDSQWKVFCEAFGFADLGADPALAANNDRVLARDAFLPRIRATLGALTKEALLGKLENLGLPYAPIARPEDLSSDVHLAAGGLVEVTLASGEVARLPALPLEMSSVRFGVRTDIPAPGQDTIAVLGELGLDGAAIEALRAARVAS